MLPPHELKRNDFTRVMRGYNASEVDEHLDFVIEKYTELYRENDALEQRLRTVTAQLEVLKKDEEAIRGALVNAQRAGAAIVSEANERADVVMRASKTNCDKILSDFRTAIRKERAELVALRETVSQFKARLFALYQDHIEFIANIPTEAEEVPAEIPSEDDLVRNAVDDIKMDITDLLVNGPRDASPDHAETEKVGAAQETYPPESTQEMTEKEEPAGQTPAEIPAKMLAEDQVAEDITNGRRDVNADFTSGAETMGVLPDTENANAEFSEELMSIPDLHIPAEDAQPETEIPAETGEPVPDKKITQSEAGKQPSGGIMASLARVQEQMEQAPAQSNAPARKARMDEADFTDTEDDYDRDLREFMESMNSEV